MESQASDDEAASEVLSHCSSASESISVAEDVTGKCGHVALVKRERGLGMGGSILYPQYLSYAPRNRFCKLNTHLRMSGSVL